MGVCLDKITNWFNMKTMIAFVALLAVATADTCTDCKALVSTLGAHLVSEHSLAEQDEILVNGLCPQAENVAECEEQLPNFWSPSLSFSGRHTTHLRLTGCVLESA